MCSNVKIVTNSHWNFAILWNKSFDRFQVSLNYAFQFQLHFGRSPSASITLEVFSEHRKDLKRSEKVWFPEIDKFNWASKQIRLPRFPCTFCFNSLSQLNSRFFIIILKNYALENLRMAWNEKKRNEVTEECSTLLEFRMIRPKFFQQWWTERKKFAKKSLAQSKLLFLFLF